MTLPVKTASAFSNPWEGEITPHVQPIPDRTTSIKTTIDVDHLAIDILLTPILGKKHNAALKRRANSLNFDFTITVN
jgi:hypothetical protein